MDQKLLTPVYLKTEEAMEWPREENAFYVLSSDGLFLCRNHAFFKSCVPTDQWPGELAGQKPFLKLNFPRIPQSLLERIVAFFCVIARRECSEAAVLLAWDRRSQTIIPVVPPQVAHVARSWYGSRYPVDVKYETPALPAHWMLIGDVHSHVDGPAYASGTDVSDERHRPGLHLVVGRIYDEPPQFHAEMTVDGYRFRLPNLDLVAEGYQARRLQEVPDDWIRQVNVAPWGSSPKSFASSPSETGTGRDQAATNDSYQPAVGAEESASKTDAEQP